MKVNGKDLSFLNENKDILNLIFITSQTEITESDNAEIEVEVLRQTVKNVNVAGLTPKLWAATMNILHFVTAAVPQ